MPSYTLVPLSTSAELDGFTCGNDDLDDFLKNDAFENQSAWLSATRLLYDADNLVGYFTLTADTLHKERIAEPDRVNDYTYAKYPCIKLARLAVDRRYQHRGIGSELMMYFFKTARDIVQYEGGRFITVDAKNTATGFYESFGFVKVTSQKAAEFVAMYIDFYKLTHIAE